MENNLPNGWFEVKLEEVGADVPYPIGDGDHGQIKPSMYQTSGIPYIRVSDMGWGEFKPDNIVYISKEVHNNNLKSELLPGDVLIAKTGATIGKCCIVPDNVPKANTTSSVGKITLDQSVMKSKWLLYFFLTREFKDYMWSISERTAQPGFNNRDIKEFVVPLPPYKEQLRILEKLDTLMTRISNSKIRLEKIPTVLKNFRQSVLAAAVSGELTKEWRKNNKNIEKAEILIKRIIDSRKLKYDEALKQYKVKKIKKPVADFDIEYSINEEIESWISAKLDNLIYISARIGWRGLKADEYTREGPLFLSVHSLNYGGAVDYRDANRISQERYDESPEIKLRQSDILLCKDGAGIGKIGFVNNLPEPATVNSSLLVIRGLEAFEPKFLFYFLKGPKLQNLAKERITGTATPHLFQKDIREFFLNIPPLEEQKEIVRIVEELFHFADSIEARYQKAKAWFDKLPQSILAKAFRGELVPQDENDEPASELLKRIQQAKQTNHKPSSNVRKRKVV